MARALERILDYIKVIQIISLLLPVLYIRYAMQYLSGTELIPAASLYIGASMLLLVSALTTFLVDGPPRFMVDELKKSRSIRTLMFMGMLLNATYAIESLVKAVLVDSVIVMSVYFIYASVYMGVMALIASMIVGVCREC